MTQQYVLTQCYSPLCSSKGSHVQNNICLQVLPCIRNTVPEHQPPLSVCVVDLYGLAGVEGVYVVRNRGSGPDTVLSNTEHCVQVLSETTLNLPGRELETRKKGAAVETRKKGAAVETRKKGAAVETRKKGAAFNPPLTAALKAPRIPAAPPQSLFIPGMKLLVLMEKPPVSYMIPLPHHAMVLVALAGVWDRTTRAGSVTAAFPTPYIPTNVIIKL